MGCGVKCGVKPIRGGALPACAYFSGRCIVYMLCVGSPPTSGPVAARLGAGFKKFKTPGDAYIFLKHYKIP